MMIMMSKKQPMQVSASSPNFSMVETDVTTIKLSGLSPNTQVIVFDNYFNARNYDM